MGQQEQTFHQKKKKKKGCEHCDTSGDEISQENSHLVGTNMTNAMWRTTLDLILTNLFDINSDHLDIWPEF